MAAYDVNKQRKKRGTKRMYLNYILRREMKVVLKKERGTGERSTMLIVVRVRYV